VPVGSPARTARTVRGDAADVVVRLELLELLVFLGVVDPRVVVELLVLLVLLVLLGPLAPLVHLDSRAPVELLEGLAVLEKQVVPVLLDPRVAPAPVAPRAVAAQPVALDAAFGVPVARPDAPAVLAVMESPAGPDAVVPAAPEEPEEPLAVRQDAAEGTELSLEVTCAWVRSSTRTPCSSLRPTALVSALACAPTWTWSRLVATDTTLSSTAATGGSVTTAMATTASSSGTSSPAPLTATATSTVASRTPTLGFGSAAAIRPPFSPRRFRCCY